MLDWVETGQGFRMRCRIGDPLDNLVYFDGEFEPEFALLIGKLAPSLKTIVDVGCNIGYISCLLAKLTNGQARLISIDANPDMVERCRENLAANGFRVEMRHCAGGATEERRIFNVPEFRPSYGTFGNLQQHSCRQIEVPVKRLDRIFSEESLTHIDLLKIDVEGYEPEVLSGLGDMAVPIENIIMEYSPWALTNCGHKPADLWAFPWWNQYQLHILEKDTGRPLPFKIGDAIKVSTDIIWARKIV